MRLIVIYLIYLIFVTNQCAYTSYAFYRVGDTLSLDVEVCCGDLLNNDESDHAWIRVYGYNFETLTLNLFKTPFCDYNSPYFISSNQTLIKEELFF